MKSKSDFITESIENGECPVCGATLEVISEYQNGENIIPGGLVENTISCPNDCELSEVL